MTIEQTVEIPASHRLIIEVPREIPAANWCQSPLQEICKHLSRYAPYQALSEAGFVTFTSSPEGMIR
jgi:hypothetical protein